MKRIITLIIITNLCLIASIFLKRYNETVSEDEGIHYTPITNIVIGSTYTSFDNNYGSIPIELNRVISITNGSVIYINNYDFTNSMSVSNFKKYYPNVARLK